MTETIRILGIDPGLRHTGWGIIDVSGTRLSRVADGTISPAPDLALADRLLAIHSGLEEIIATHRPVEAAAEETFMASNAASALKLGHARAAALLAPARAGLPVAEYAARLVKKSVVGTGGADKNQIAAMIAILLPGCKAKDDAADALAVAICHAHHRKAASMGSAA
ncbi:crossover junction endodeoxyribonuclease RuvC [Hyphobacterium sp. HN65]|uniref:Crossover junction endodeoxyribonuclease RuvC n=1 Tax=Hyphobacterium lacteum TaxID=3116575 RepID=A0ABU7LPS0_9PROT|nr:crossover junction endodeoxyribonuclease RuvC [Hyphobacterium sp. HN65]MEE2525902.1 crossover junction endodeoxyribonuclease RuvC [Hyphobacterium sp. HN65]